METTWDTTLLMGPHHGGTIKAQFSSQLWNTESSRVKRAFLHIFHLCSERKLMTSSSATARKCIFAREESKFLVLYLYFFPRVLSHSQLPRSWIETHLVGSQEGASKVHCPGDDSKQTEYFTVNHRGRSAAGCSCQMLMSPVQKA